MKPVVIVIGGTDSSGGAGLSRDIATLTEIGCEARPVITAVTAQTDKAVQSVTAISPDQVARQLSSALASGPVSAVKTGMLQSDQTVSMIAKILQDERTIPLVIDPVLVSSSGTRLLSRHGIDALKSQLLPLCTLLTPNLPEAEMLTEHQHPDQQAQALLELGAESVLIKGGHGTGDRSVDRLYQAGQPVAQFTAPRLQANLRGTGCMLASAIAANLGLDASLKEACTNAKQFVTRGLQRIASEI